MVGKGSLVKFLTMRDGNGKQRRVEERKGKSRKKEGTGAMWPEDKGIFARRCGAKHIFKSKCTKHTRSGPLLEVRTLKNCTPLLREAYFQVKMH